MANFKVEYYENATARKQGNMFGVFYPVIDIVEVPAVSESLKGKQDADGNDLYELAVQRREAKVAKSLVDAKFAACDAVRNVVGPDGVLVASIIEEQEDITDGTGN